VNLFISIHKTISASRGSEMWVSEKSDIIPKKNSF
jgi:hypothetical protein